MDPVQIGQRIRNFRKHRKMTQEALAEAADLSASYLSHIETGKKTASLLAMRQIADALEIRLEELLFDFTDTHEALLPEMQKLLENSTPQERCFLYETVRAMKQNLRDHHLVQS